MDTATAKKREPKPLAKRTQAQEEMQALILAELSAADGGPLLETTIARGAGLYRRRSAWGITEFRLLVDDLAARGKVRLGPIGLYGSVEIELAEAAPAD